MCIFRGYISVNEYVGVDRCVWIGELGSLTEIPVLWSCLYRSKCMDRGVLFAWGIHLCGSVCMICLVLFWWIRVCVFFMDMFLLMNMFVWIGEYGSGCVKCLVQFL